LEHVGDRGVAAQLENVAFSEGARDGAVNHAVVLADYLRAYGKGPDTT
jgi:hypothetical protein